MSVSNSHPILVDPKDRELLEKIGRLRVLAWSAFIPNFGSRSQVWLDEFEMRSLHWCIFIDGEPVAAARMSIHTSIEDVPDYQVYRQVFRVALAHPIASFNRLVVHPDYQGRGFSGALDSARFEHARSAGCRCCIAATPSGVKRLEQFRRLGFQTIGQPVPEPMNHVLAGLMTQVVFADLDR